MHIFDSDFIHPVQAVGAAAVGTGAVGSAFRPAKRFALAAGLAAGLAAALAAGGVVAKAPGSALAYQHLFTLTSALDEPLHAFLLRVAQRQRQFSDETGLEACGLIAQDTDTGRYGVVVGTSGAHIGCVVYNVLPRGMTSTNEDIHSHGSRKTYHMNGADFAFGLLAGIHVRPGRGFSPDTYRFSKTDLAGLAGYLATPSGITYHNGDRVIRDVASYESIVIASASP